MKHYMQLFCFDIGLQIVSEQHVAEEVPNLHKECSLYFDLYNNKLHKRSRNWQICLCLAKSLKIIAVFFWVNWHKLKFEV